MCGIAGKITPEPSPEAIQTVTRMCDRIAHRGPDAWGVKQYGRCTLGHRRLSIIDLSDRAAQPMSTADGRFHISFNGEVYNFAEIRKDLEKLGVQFKSDSDTEVVLYAFAEWGAQCLPKFNGMFAFAIWDATERQLFLARDRFGQKPLFYCSQPGKTFSFCSELTGLQIDPGVPSQHSLEGLNHYLALGYILSPLTMYEEVFQLRPGHCMRVNADGKVLGENAWWDYAAAFSNKTKASETDIAAELLRLLKQSVKRRMVADVPVGAFLSGGIDSSSVVAAMKEFHAGELHTFSVGFAQESYNELPDADRTAKYVGTQHHGLVVGKENPAALLAEAVGAFDQVFADNSLIPMVEVSKLASKHVTVVLSGDAADELFAGYITYDADRYYKIARLFPRFLRKFLSNFSGFSNTKQKLNASFKRRQFFYGSLGDYRQAHYSWRLFFRPEERVAILGAQHRDLVFDTDPFRHFQRHYAAVPHLAPLDQHLYVDAMTWLTDDILVKVDRSSMHSSIEARAPYLDVDLVRFAASIPAHLKMKGSDKKYILKKALRPLLPDFVLDKKKSGFNAPVNAWIDDGSGENEFRMFNRWIYQRVTGKTE